MLEISFSNIKKEIWFNKTAKLSNAFLLVDYKQILKRKIWYKSNVFHTIIINLNDSVDKIRQGFKKNYKNEINKAKRLNISFSEEKDLISFKIFYNNFAILKNLNLIDELFNNYLPHIKITKAIFNEEALVMHLYLFDEKTKRVRLLYSATSVSFDDKQIIGIANKFLHFEDMKLFKENGFENYDLGGINLDSENKHIQGINNFKKGFGGTILKEYNLVSYPLFFLRKFR